MQSIIIMHAVKTRTEHKSDGKTILNSEIHKELGIHYTQPP